MVRPLLGHQQLIASYDPESDQLDIVGTVAGPAGTATIEFDDLVIDIDVANPRSVAFVTAEELSAEGRGERLKRLFVRLFGDAAAAAIAQLIESGEAGRVRVGDVGRSTQPGPREMVEPAIADLAIALAQANAPGLLPVERALGTLEAAGIAAGESLLDQMTQLQHDAVQAAGVLAAASAQEIAALGPTVCDRLSSVLDKLPADGAELAQLEHLRSMTNVAPSREPDRPSGRENLSAVDEALVIAPESLPSLVGGPPLSFARVSGDEFEARLAGWGSRADGWWVRAFDAEGTVPLALVPLRLDGDDAVARLVVPPQHQAQLQIDVVDEPLEPRLSRDAAAFRVAVATGQRAAQYERLGEDAGARRAWADAASWHRRAGDDRRARQAEAVARQRKPAREVRPALLSDYLDLQRRSRPVEQ